MPREMPEFFYLPRKERKVWMLHIRGGKSKDIAPVLGMSPQQVSRYLWKARKRVARADKALQERIGEME